MERTLEWGPAQVARADGISRQTAWRRLRTIRAEHPELVRLEGRRLLIRKSIYEARFARGATPLIGTELRRIIDRLTGDEHDVQELRRRVDAMAREHANDRRDLRELRDRIHRLEQLISRTRAA